MKRYCIEFEIFEGQGGQLVKEGDDGQVFSNLYPFRESFYERLGYVTFPLPRIAKLAPSALLPLMEKDLGGQVELMLIGDGFDIYREYLGKLRQRTHGMATFVIGDRAAARRNRSWLALAKVQGEPVGLMLYQWIARHTDQASQAEIWLAPFEQPETWLSDVQVKTESQTRAPMGRVLDVSRLGGCRLDRGAFLRGSPIRSARGMRASGGSSRRMERCKSRGRTRQIAF